ncbi:response regulator transcription factor [Dyadobacter arcticus]|uniref:DNA-binding CsgD family transcriptional regulator n=1 Tax=Dyadobacter arcticus TaxID=1078754 RepID=A0ABX0UM61_9BACT|nr:helix-turn-helix transcriptional regulator [Dyadobacter arcticus]NIJ54083.1 DNA-binding CsgD family transcriptional regulator [Dyadobacter arcticus]
MFTERETQIILLTAKGHKSAAIAQALFITRETLKSHKKNIIRKVRRVAKSELSLLEFAIDYAEKAKISPQSGDLH